MTLEELVIDEFHKLFYEWIFEDLSSGIENKQNYLVALGLLSYIEYLGSILSGNVGVNVNNKDNFDFALSLFPTTYNSLNSTIKVIDADGKERTGIYSVVRCGLAHEYGIKGLGGVINNPDGYTTRNVERPLNSPSGIRIVYSKGAQALELDNNRLLYDFKSVVDQVFEDLKNNQDPTFTNVKESFLKFSKYTIQA